VSHPGNGVAEYWNRLGRILVWSGGELQRKILSGPSAGNMAGKEIPWFISAALRRNAPAGGGS